MDRSVRNNSYSANGGSRPNHHVNNYNGKNRSSGGYSNNSSSNSSSSGNSRVSPTTETPSTHSSYQQEELVNYIFESWDKVSREADRGSDVKYYQCTRQFANFVPFDLETLCNRRPPPAQNIKRPQHNS